jgi:hypothetical protein
VQPLTQQHKLQDLPAASAAAASSTQVMVPPAAVQAVLPASRVTSSTPGGASGQTSYSSSSSSSEDDSDYDDDDEQQWSDGDDNAAAVAAISSGGCRKGERTCRGDLDPGSSSSSSDCDSDGSSGTDGGDDVTDALRAVLPFLDTSGVTVHLSEFGLLWSHLHNWVSPASLAYVNDRQADDGINSSVNSSDRRGDLPDGNNGTSAVASAADVIDIAGDVTPSLVSVQQRAAMVSVLAAVLPHVVKQLGVKVPVSVLDKQLQVLVRSFVMPGPLPALQKRQWQLIVALMLAALSAWRLPVLRPVFFGPGRTAGSRLEQLVVGLGSDLDRFGALLDLFELQV